MGGVCENEAWAGRKWLWLELTTGEALEAKNIVSMQATKGENDIDSLKKIEDILITHYW